MTRGRYLYDSASPSRGVMTERLGQGGTFEKVDFMEASECMKDDTYLFGQQSDIDLKGDMGGFPRRSSMARRDTSGSTSSLDELSGSGTSSASLLSLGRSSLEHNVRPSMVTIWTEEKDDPDEEGLDPETPSRHHFSLTRAGDRALQLSGKTACQSPGKSPLNGKTDAYRNAPNHEHLLPLAMLSPISTARSGASPSPAKEARSPLTKLFPRLLASTNKSKAANLELASPRIRGSRQDLDELKSNEEMIIGAEGIETPARSSRLYASWKKDRRHEKTLLRNDSSPQNGIGLGIRRSSDNGLNSSKLTMDRTVSFARSCSSESSGDIDASPSRFLSARASIGREFLDLPAPISNSILQGRRKSLAGPTKPPTEMTPITGGSRSRPTRPALRRGITEPGNAIAQSKGTPNAFLSVHTPFADIKPSPAAFASTGLLKKKSRNTGFIIPQFGEAIAPANSTKSTASINAPGITPMPEGSSLIKVAQKTRGLRRKGSTIFASGSSGSIGEGSRIEGASSPATPTKPALQGECNHWYLGRSQNK